MNADERGYGLVHGAKLAANSGSDYLRGDALLAAGLAPIADTHTARAPSHITCLYQRSSAVPFNVRKQAHD